MKILIDNGHGIQTNDKRSPDGTLLEYAYTSDLARRSSQSSNSEATTPNTWYLKTTTSLYQKEYDASTPIVKPSAKPTSSSSPSTSTPPATDHNG